MSLFNKYTPFKNEVIAYLERCKTAFQETGNTASSKDIEAFIRDFDQLRYNLTIIGSLKRGKSTLLNTLMERKNDNISPISSQVCTSAIIKYLDKDLNKEDNSEKAVIYFDNGEPTSVSLERLQDYVTETNNPKNSKQVKSVEVYGDFPAWSKAVTIVDSPGQNAVYDYHDTLLTDFLPSTDAIIFLIAADLPLDGGDLKLLEELSRDQKRKIFFVLTKIDTADNPEDLREVEQHVMHVVNSKNIPCDKLYKISAKPVFNSLKKGVTGPELDELKAKHGILALEKDLEKFIIENSEQTEVLRNRIGKILGDTQCCCNSYIEEKNELLSKQNFDFKGFETEFSSLKDKNEELRDKTRKALRKFEREWSKRLSSFSRSFTSKAPKIDDNIMDSLEKSGFYIALFKSFKLKKQVEKAVNTELQPLISDLEEKLQETVEKLNNEFDDEIAIYFKKSHKADILTPGASVATAAALAGTATWAWSFSSPAINGAVTAFKAWTTAAGASSTAATVVAGNHAAAGAVSNVWTYLFGQSATSVAGKASIEATKAAATATSTGISAISSIGGAVVSMGVSIAVTYIVQKLLHIGLVQIQSSRVPALSEKIMEEMETSLFKSLEAMKKGIVEEYTQRIEDLINDNQERMDDISKILESNDPEARALLESQITRIKALIPIGNRLQSEIPMLEK